MRRVVVAAASMLVLGISTTTWAGATIQPAADPLGQAEAGSTAQPQRIPADTAAGFSAVQLLGHEVIDQSGQSLGVISDLVFGEGDRITRVAIDVGGFLGVGTRTVALPLGQVHRHPQDPNVLFVSLLREQIAALPEYQPPSQVKDETSVAAELEKMRKQQAEVHTTLLAQQAQLAAEIKQQQSLVLMQLGSLKSVLGGVQGADQDHIAEAIDRAMLLAQQPAPNKDEIGAALAQALQYAANGHDLSAQGQTLTPIVVALVGWLGNNWEKLLPMAGVF